MLGRKSRMIKLAIISAIVLGFLLPASIIFSAGSAEPTEFLTIRIDDPQQINALQARGAEIVADYNNGYVLAKVGLGQGSYLDRYFDVERMNDWRRIDITHAGMSITPGREIPSIPKDLTYKRATDEYIVQFAGPIKKEWTDAITDLGGEAYFYYQYYSMLVKIPTSKLSALKSLPFVNWVGSYQPAYKVAAGLQHSEGGQLIAVHAYNNVDTVEFANKLDSIGATVMTSSSSPTVVLVNADSSIIPDIAAMPEVKALYPEGTKQMMDSVAGEIHKYHYAWYPDWSGLPAPPTPVGIDGTVLTGRLPGADGILYTGDDEYEIGGVVDSGFDVSDPNNGHTDFFDSPNTDRIIDYYAASSWAQNWPDGWGIQCEPHGTACVGIMASDGYAWESSPFEGVHSTTDKEWHQGEAGVAPEAKMTVAGVPGNFGQGILGWYSYLGTNCGGKPCWDRMYENDGARTISNSWGGAGGYQPYVDDRIDKRNDFMIIYAAGNDGPSPDTIGEPGAKSKNGLSIGASQNYRPDYFGADNPNLMADFSSRGGTSVSNGRIKPDIVAIGTAGITTMGPYGYRCNRDHSTWGQGVPQPDYIMQVDEYNHTTKEPGSDGINDYRYFSGTSQASPMAAGNYMLIREYVREIAHIPYVNSSLAKALMINGAVRMSEDLYDYPGWDQGWGRVNLQESLFPTPPRTNQFIEGWFNNTGSCDIGTGTCSDPVNSTLTGTISTNVASSATPLKVTLVWIDSPMSELLVRDLNLRVVSPSGIEYRGNAYNNSGMYRGWSAPNPETSGVDNTKWDWWSSGSGWDNLNTVEQIEVEFPEQGIWTVQVNATNIPLGFANFSVVFAADIGPQVNYKVDLSSEYPPAISVALGGTASYPFTVTNFGSLADTIQLSPATTPLTIDFAPVPPYSLAPLESQSSMILITAPESGLAPGTYKLRWDGISQGDSDITDFLEITVEVLASPIPSPMQITTETTNDVDPSVLVFDNGAEKHIFIAYVKTVPLNPPFGGDNVWVAHTTLETDGMPIEPWDYMEVSNLNDFPKDIRFNYIKTGTYAGRVLMTWTGYDPQWGVDQMWWPWSRIAYSDPPYDTWTVGLIDLNSGEQTVNSKRVSFTLFRQTTGELLYIWEYLGASSPEDNPSVVQTWWRKSMDGGTTWSSPLKLFPRPGETNKFYFFPTGCIDQNDVAWIFVYYRLPTGNDRDLKVALYDGTWSTTTPLIWDTSDNVQFPMCMSTNEGSAGNRVYFTLARDLGGSDYTIWVSWTDGDYTSSTPPVETPAGDDSLSASFGGTYGGEFDPSGRTGPGHLGPYTVSMSDANYDRGPLIILLNTTEPSGQRIWISYIEDSHLDVPPWPANPYDAPNIWTIHSNDTFATMASNPNLIKVTADAFAKGHRMADALQIGGQGIIYETFHSNKGGLKAVDYNVYLTIYTQDWNTKPDILGPITSNVFAIPNPFNVSTDTDFELTANINDLVTGMNDIDEAQYTETPTSVSSPFDVDWGLSIPMTLSYAWPPVSSPTPSETANATITPVAWLPGEVHRFWVRGKDAVDNWGKGAYVDVYVTGATGVPPGAPILTSVELAGAGNADVLLAWTLSPDDGGPTFDGYDVYAGSYYSTGRLGYHLLTSTPLAAGTTTYTHTGKGVGDTNNYFYVVVARDTNGLKNASPQQGAKLATYYTTGAHFISIPLNLSTTDLPTILGTMDYTIAWWFDPMDLTDPWKSYNPSKTYNDLSTYNRTMGLWVEAASDSYLTIAGMIPATPTDIQLKAGWNLIGYPSLATKSTAKVFENILGPLRVEGYDPTNPPQNLKLMDDGDLLMPTYGYWVKVDSDQTLTI